MEDAHRRGGVLRPACWLAGTYADRAGKLMGLRHPAAGVMLPH